MQPLSRAPLAQLLAAHPYLADFLDSLGLPPPGPGLCLAQWLASLADDDFLEAGLAREQVLPALKAVMGQMDQARQAAPARLESLTLLGGQDKQGRPEALRLTLWPGQVVCLVGPTGSGKSRLLDDLECLAQGDTPSRRRVLVNGRPPGEEERFAASQRLVAQLSQGMQFVADLSARELIAVHARCRQAAEPEEMARRVISCANTLAGERFSPEESVTQLSGGQARALMIADLALLSSAPVVVIDEIENAGLDHRRALELLMGKGRIVLVSTHDPLLALRGQRRLVIAQGGIAQVLETSPAERRALAQLEALEDSLLEARRRLRQGQRLEEAPAWRPPQGP